MKEKKSIYQRSRRFFVKLEIYVKTFGSRENDLFETINISNTGVVVGCQRNSPFRLNSLIEMVLKDSFFSCDIKIIGKIVRIAGEKTMEVGDYHSAFGVRFLELTDYDQKKMDNLLEKLQETHGDVKDEI